jgi:hypothetical protein
MVQNNLFFTQRVLYWIAASSLARRDNLPLTNRLLSLWMAPFFTCHHHSLALCHTVKLLLPHKNLDMTSLRKMSGALQTMDMMVWRTKAGVCSHHMNKALSTAYKSEGRMECGVK